MPIWLQDAIVLLVALGAAFVVVRRVFGAFTPRPQKPAEAHYVALVFRTAARARLRPGHPVLLYYTLELARSFEGENPTMLCGWSADRAHLNFGRGPLAEPDAFVAAVSEQVRVTEEREQVQAIAQPPAPPSQN